MCWRSECKAGFGRAVAIYIPGIRYLYTAVVKDLDHQVGLDDLSDDQITEANCLCFRNSVYFKRLPKWRSSFRGRAYHLFEKRIDTSRVRDRNDVMLITNG